jgi:hypothetical protein
VSSPGAQSRSAARTPAGRLPENHKVLLQH